MIADFARLTALAACLAAPAHAAPITVDGNADRSGPYPVVSFALVENGDVLPIGTDDKDRRAAGRRGRTARQHSPAGAGLSPSGEQIGDIAPVEVPRRGGVRQSQAPRRDSPDQGDSS